MCRGGDFEQVAPPASGDRRALMFSAHGRLTVNLSLNYVCTSPEIRTQRFSRHAD